LLLNVLHACEKERKEATILLDYEGFSMSKVCQITGRKPVSGFSYVTRGIAKKKKGIGLKVTGKTRRRFQPNLKVKRFWLSEEKRFVTLKLSCAAMRTIEKKGLSKIVRDLRKDGQKV
jgi:large subunit ribosomal protein L28